MDILCLNLQYTPKLYLQLDLLMQSKFISLIAPSHSRYWKLNHLIGVCNKRLNFLFCLYHNEPTKHIHIQNWLLVSLSLSEFVCLWCLKSCIPAVSYCWHKSQPHELHGTQLLSDTFHNAALVTPGVFRAAPLSTG